MEWKKIFHFIFYMVVPLAILGTFLYRAMWTLAAFHFAHTVAGWRYTNNNIKISTQWLSSGTEWQLEFGHFVNGKPAHPVKDFFSGWPMLYLLPLILITPGFYAGMFWGKNDPQISN